MKLRMRKMAEILLDSGLAVAGIQPIRVWDKSADGGAWILPSISNREGIPTLWESLGLVHDDWIREAARFSYAEQQELIPDLSWESFFMEAMLELRPRYIQCLFSYINLFYVLDNGFNVMFDELKELHWQLRLTSRIAKKPVRPAYLKVLRRVRNHTTVHWGGPKNKNLIDSRAGRMWGFSLSAQADTLVDLEFGNASLVGADDRRLLSIPETHLICTSYLKELDERCATLLEEIASELPMTIGQRQYSQ